MMKQMKRTVYEAPVTERFQVELEGVFCASASIKNPDNGTGRIDEQEVNTGFSADFSSESWDASVTPNQ